MNLPGSSESPTAVQYRLGCWDSSLVNSALIRSETTGHPRDWMDYIDICQSIRGLTLRDWQHVANHYCALQRRSPKLFLKLLNLLQTPGLFPELTEAERKARSENLPSPDRIRLSGRVSDIAFSGYLGSRLSHYPRLLATAGERHDSSLKRGPLIRGRRLSAARLLDLSLPFEDMIMQTLSSRDARRSMSIPPSIAVVGNSPTILDAEAGADIDSADLVIRFNNASIQPDKIRYTGNRTDIWVMSPSTPVAQCPVDARVIVVSGLNALTRASFYWTRLPGMGRYLSEFPASRWHELVTCFRAPPSAGTLVLASLGSLDLDIRCHGFTRNRSDHAHRQNHHSDARSRSRRHNWQAEASWLLDHFPSEKLSLSRASNG